MANPKILFIASKEPSYSRVALVLAALSQKFEVTAITSTAAGYPGRLIEIARRLIQYKGAFDAVFIGFLAQPLYPLVRLKTSKPVFSDAYFSLYDTVINDKKLFRRWHPVSIACHWLDKLMLHGSKAVFSDTNTHATYLARSCQVPSGKIHRLWISAQPEIFKPLPPLGFSPDKDIYRVLFYGGFIPLQGVDIILRAASLLRGRNIQFSIVGTGQTFQSCQKLNNSLQNTHVTFLGWKKQDEIISLAAQSHLLLGIFGGSEKASRVIPNKLYEGLSLGKPVLTGDSAAIRELLRPGHDILTCRINDPLSLKDSILDSMNDYPATLGVAARGLETFLDQAAPEHLSNVLHHVISSTQIACIRPTAT